MYNKNAMKELKRILIEKYPEEIDRMILFGSRAENKEREFSDYNILLILKNKFDWKFKKKIRDITFDIILKYDIITDMKFISRNELNSIEGNLPFVKDALSKGLTLWL